MTINLEKNADYRFLSQLRMSLLPIGPAHVTVLGSLKLTRASEVGDLRRNLLSVATLTPHFTFSLEKVKLLPPRKDRPRQCIAIFAPQGGRLAKIWHKLCPQFVCSHCDLEYC